MLSAVQYAGLVGRYIRMERPSVGPYEASDGPTVGMSCLVAVVLDQPDGIVEIVSDEGFGFAITPADADRWRFMIFPDEETSQSFQAASWGIVR
jgi:hypothetical protein